MIHPGSIRQRLLLTHLLVAGSGILAITALLALNWHQRSAHYQRMAEHGPTLQAVANGMSGLALTRTIESDIRLRDQDEAREALALIWTRQIRPATDVLLQGVDPARAGLVRHHLDALKDAQLDATSNAGSDSLAAGLTRFLVEEARRHVDRTTDDIESSSREAVLLACAVVLALGLCVLAWDLSLRCSRQLVEPLNELRTSARAFAAGGRYRRIKVAATDEVSDLAQTLDGIFISIQESSRLMKANEARVRAIVETAPDAILTLDEQAIIQSINPSGCGIFGLTEEDLVAQPVALILPSPADAAIIGFIEACMAGTESSRSIELQARGGRNRRFPALVSIGGTFERSWLFTLILRDITERVEAERELTRLLDQSTAATRAKTAFIANVTHELRTPLTGILGYSEELLEANLDPQDRDNAARIIHQSGQHLLHLINDILDFSKSDASKIVVERIACSPAEIVEEAMNWVRAPAEAKNLDLDVVFDRNVPDRIYSDPTRVRQVLLNLLGNAVKFTERGGVRLRVGSVREGDQHLLRIAVRDTGPGMTRAQLDRLFKPFSQADASTTRKYGGTGLGLAITKTLCEALGGRVTVESRPGQGSTFTMTISAAAAPQEPEAPETGSANLVPDRLDGLSVLVAEDTPVNQVLICRLMERLGAIVTLVDDGRKAVDTAEAATRSGSPFDVILMDMQMPVLDGYEATRELRDGEYRGLIIALTANAMAADRDRALAAGCDEFASKPINLANLVGKILAGRTTRDAAA
jgi:PAS domain S-box-containing protein